MVGAGFGGIGAGVKLKQAGIDTFTIYESSTGIGGTWWDNTYPGAEVDVNSNLYRYSFKPHRWTRSHAGQPELQAYLEETVDEFGLWPHLQLGVAVRSAVWGDSLHVWTVTLDTGDLDILPRRDQRRRISECPAFPDLAGIGGLRWATVPHLPLGPSSGSVRGGRRCRGDWVDGHPGGSGHPTHRGEALCVPAGAGVGPAQGRAPVHRGRTSGAGQALVARLGPVLVEVGAVGEHHGSGVPQPVPALWTRDQRW